MEAVVLLVVMFRVPFPAALKMSFRESCISAKSISLVESIDWIEVLLIMRRFSGPDPRHLSAVSCRLFSR